MIINKYNSSKGGTQTRVAINTGAISSGSSTTGGGGDLDRTLWGQNDDGSDIDGSMWVNGSMYLGEIDYGSEDDESTTSDASETFVDEAEVGSVIASGLVQGKDMYCKEHPYITYPITNGKKTDLRLLLNSFDSFISTNATNIATNTSNINSLKTRVTTLENKVGDSTDFGELKTRVTTLEGKVDTNTNDITNLKTRVTNLENGGGSGSGGTDLADLKAKVDTNTNDIAAIKDSLKNFRDSMPVGSIIMFNGQAEEIPSGWAMCNGANGTPNLINRFVLASTAPGEKGGAATIKLTAEQLPRHNHSVSKCYFGGSNSSNGNTQVVKWNNSFSDSESITTSETGAAADINIMPPYYRLIYIMKIATT